MPFTDVININFSKTTDLNTVQVVLFDFNMMPTGINFDVNNGSLISENTCGLTQPNYIIQIIVSGETKTTTVTSKNIK